MPAPVTEPLFASGLSYRIIAVSRYAARPEPVEEAEIEEPTPMAVPDDIEVPAFMRRERRLYR